VNLRRLRLLEKAVREQPDELFDMANWVEPGPCGTVCCAAGSYAVRYPKGGLSLQGYGEGNRVRSSKTPGIVEFEACAEVFGMTEDEAEQLFSPYFYMQPTKPNVLGRIRSYIRKAERERAKRKAVRA